LGNVTAKPSKAAVFGAANGVAFMAFFGALWASIGIVGTQNIGVPALLVVPGLMTLILLFGAFSLFGKARRMDNAATPAEKENANRTNRRFGLIFGLEGLAIMIASVLCNLFDRFEIFFPIMAIIVGLHFFPLARLFRENFYVGTGVVLCVLGIVSFFIPLDASIGDVSIVARSAVIGYGSALTLWVTGLRIWIALRRR